MTFEEFIAEGLFVGVLDLGPHDFANEIFGRVYIRGAPRFTVAGKKGIPQVISTGGLAWLDFVKEEDIPQSFLNRPIWYHNKYAYSIILTAKELSLLGKEMAKRLNKAKGPVAVVIPLRGWGGSGLTLPEIPSKDECKAFSKSLLEHVRRDIDVMEVDMHINEPKFAEFVVPIMLDMLKD